MLLCWTSALRSEVRRVVVVKADGLPGWFVEDMLQADAATAEPQLPWLDRIFVKRGVWVRNFYSRGISLSVPSWSILETGKPLAIHGNVEYDRFTLRVFDYLNFVPFYFKSAFSKSADMPAVEMLDSLGIPLLADRFGPDAVSQSFQLFQRGIRWDTLKRAATAPFPLTSPRDLIDEWHSGFEVSRSLENEVERNLINALADDSILYLDLYTGEFDHVAHLNNDADAQRYAVRRLDAMVGRIWSAIEHSDLADYTLLALVSDHGMTTDPEIYSQGYNLVDLLRSVEGGAHHVVTNRHPLSGYKLRGLYPFVHKVFTAREAEPFGGVSPKDYPTALLDLDGNERAAIHLRNSDLNEVHLLLTQLARKNLAPDLRIAAEEACRHALERYARRAVPRMADLQEELSDLRTKVKALRSTVAGAERSISRRRMSAAIRSSNSDIDAYEESLQSLERLFAATNGIGKAKTKIVPKRMMGEPNTIHQLQDYVVSVAPHGLQLHADGTLDRSRSFRRLDYFKLLTGIAVRNVVQEGVSGRPVDFVAVGVVGQALETALPGERAVMGVWLYAADDRQILLLANTSGELKLVPVAGLREDSDGRITLDRRNWTAGLPLRIFEDDNFAIPPPEREQWLAEWRTEREWLDASHRTHYSNAVPSLYEHFRQLTADLPEGFHWAQRGLVQADLLVFAADHWNFNVKGFNPGGNHGGLFRTSAQALLMMAGGAETGVNRSRVVETPYDALSFIPTLLNLMGKCEPSLPGPHIEEAGKAMCRPDALPPAAGSRP